MKKLISFILIITISLSCLLAGGCKKEEPQGAKEEKINYVDPMKDIEVKNSTDKYRNFYQIFVGSFCDSNNDGIGDLQGIISKLDYLNDGDNSTNTDLGVDGIWLTPIMPSRSYHKYDVKDYFNIDEQFGTLKDFDMLIEECHKRGIKVIIDMVLNHCSNYFPLFENACKEALQGNLNGDAKYFEIDCYEENPGSSYTEIGDGYYYISNFSPHMPEWDLNAQCTRDYFIDIAKFWINEHNVDGFRLDALKYFDDMDTDGKEFLKWYYEAVKEIKPDVYMVGEHWVGNIEIYDMYNTKIDSLFAFEFAGAAGEFIRSVRLETANTFVTELQKYYRNTKETNKDSINAFFLSNHDQIRSGNSLKGDTPSDTKMAAAAYMLVPGNSFIYYGEEIGMVQDSQADGDEYKREPMVWDKTSPPTMLVNGTTGYDETQVPYGGVKQQQEDENSILNYYKRVIKIKNQNPEIARGEIAEAVDFEDKNILAFNIEYKGSKVMIIHNLSSKEDKEINLENVIENPVIRGDLVASNFEGTNKYISLEGNVLKMPTQSTVVLKTAE